MTRPGITTAFASHAANLNPEAVYIEIIELQVDEFRRVYLNNSDRDIEFQDKDGNTVTFFAYPFQIQLGGEDSDGKIGEATVLAANAAQQLSIHMYRGNGFVDREITLGFLYWTGPGTSTNNVYRETMRIISSEDSEQSVTLRCGNENFWRQSLPRPVFNRFTCRWRYKSLECGYGLHVLDVTSATNTTPIVVTVDAEFHGLAEQEQVIISNVLGNTAANGTFNIRNPRGNSFELYASGSPVAGNGAYTGGGQAFIDRRQYKTISNVANTTPIEITTSTPHTITTGSYVSITGTSVTDGKFLVTKVSDTKFTLNGTTAAGTVATGTVQIDKPTCDRGLRTANGCLSHNNNLRFGGFPAIKRPR